MKFQLDKSENTCVSRKKITKKNREFCQICEKYLIAKSYLPNEKMKLACGDLRP